MINESLLFKEITDSRYSVWLAVKTAPPNKEKRRKALFEQFNYAKFESWENLKLPMPSEGFGEK